MLFGVLDIPPGNQIRLAKCDRIYFAISAARMDIQFDYSDCVHSLQAFLVCVTERFFLYDSKTLRYEPLIRGKGWEELSHLAENS